MRHRSILAALAATALAATAAVAVGTPSTATPTSKGFTPSGSFSLTGADADAFVLPSDVREVGTTRLANGLTQTRYQQYVDGASVIGGQVTVLSDAAGERQAVIGAYFSGLAADNSRKITKGTAKGIVADRIGSRGVVSASYRLDPRSGRLLYAVDTIRAAQRPVRWVDAGTGRIVKAFDALTHGTGIGVKGDGKEIDTTLNQTSGLYELLSADGRQKTFDVQNRLNSPVLMTDADDVWDLAGDKSPGQAAGVDAHYYANVVDDFYLDTFGRDSIDDAGMQIRSYVHYGNRYCNAFWNGLYMTYGDGDGRTCLSLSGGLDVDGHELTHGVTEHTSNLIYENQPGALNEAFSDMMGNTVEFYADDNGLDPAAQPDWLIGEDVIPATRTDLTPGFRNMSDPAEDGDPDHIVDLYTGTSDNGGVHSNSGIPNHVYYLLVAGGQNAGCTAGDYRDGPTHTEDCDVTVPAIGLDTTAQVFYAGFTSLPEYGNFCDARGATVAAATALGANAAAVGLAWDAVGVHGGCEGGTPPPPPCEGGTVTAFPFETPHPYGNNGDCTWTYDSGSASGFRFHFASFDTEAGYDYVYIKDASGNVVATYDGTKRRPFYTPCIPTQVGSVQLVTDPAVTGDGFVVDAAEAC